jgi:hypothetical protein
MEPLRHKINGERPASGRSQTETENIRQSFVEFADKAQCSLGQCLCTEQLTSPFETPQIGTYRTSSVCGSFHHSTYIAGNSELAMYPK